MVKIKHYVILDACTLINLLRIDQDEFLLNSLKVLELNITSKVYNEVKNNIKKNYLSNEQIKHIDQVIPQLLLYCHKDEVIIENISPEFLNQIRHFSQHRKQDNGELISSALSLYLSRDKRSKVFFYTDDFPAKNQFEPFFNYQQIGAIGDSVDLLLFMYWIKSDFDFKRLKGYLQDLKSEYNQPLKQFISKIQSKKDLFTRKENKNKELVENVNKILKGYEANNIKLLLEGVNFFNSTRKYTAIKKIVVGYPNLSKESLLANKIQGTLEYLSSYKIFKIV
jgi:hypothetical protein